MDPFLAVLLAFTPGLLWLWFFRCKDDLDPEPLWLLLKMFSLGVLAALLVLYYRPPVEALIVRQQLLSEPLTDAFLTTALFEETMKATALFLGIWWHREFDEPLDGVVYGIAVALGFASLENFVFSQITGDASLVLMRTFTATLAHVSFAAFFGFCLGIARFGSFARGLPLTLTGFLLAVLVHGAYDFCLAGQLGWLALVVLLPCQLILLGAKIRWGRSQSPTFHPDLVP